MVAKNFPGIVDIKFTAKMEDELDGVAENTRRWEEVVKEFYEPFGQSLKIAEASIEKIKINDEVTGELCPECGKPLVIKTGRFGRFLACSGYPDCKYHRSIQATTGVSCPVPGCGGEIRILRSKKGKTFYGCSNYEKCGLKPLNQRPLKQKCPECGWIMVEKNKKAKCQSEKCGYSGPIEEPKEDKAGVPGI
jgi:DNA topoisomerase-1